MKNNAELKGHISSLNGKIADGSSSKFNALVSSNAVLHSQLSELQSRISLVSQDKDRLAAEVGSRMVQQISYTVPGGDINSLKKELEHLLNQNNSLIG